MKGFCFRGRENLSSITSEWLLYALLNKQTLLFSCSFSFWYDRKRNRKSLLSIMSWMSSLQIFHPYYYPYRLTSFLLFDVNSEIREEEFNLKATIIPSQMSSLLIAPYIITEKSSKRLHIKTYFFKL